MPEIEFALPDPDEPGYLMREKKRLEYFAAMQEGSNPESIDKMIEFLLPYVKKPKDREEARSTMWTLSKNQFIEILNVVSGGGVENPTI